MKTESHSETTTETEKSSVSNIERGIDLIVAKLDKISAVIENINSASRETRNLVGPFGIPFPDGSVLVQTIYGIKYFIDAQDMVMTPQLIIYRQWEKDLSQFFLAALHQDCVFVDVGANVGYFTCLLGAYIGRSGKGQVFAFEPNPSVFSLLERNVQINWSMAPVKTFQAAVGNSDGMVELTVPRYGAANATLAKISGNAEVTRIDVKQCRLDSIIPAETKVDLMKIDVEGFELFVLEGIAEIIKRSPYIKIVIEWSIPQMITAKVDPQSIIEFCHKMDMGFYSVPNTYSRDNSFDWSQFKLTPEALLSRGYDNVILIKNDNKNLH